MRSRAARAVGGLINLPAAAIGLLMTGLLIIGTRESATVNAVLATHQGCGVAAVRRADRAGHAARTISRRSRRTAFSASISGMGIAGAAASIFFAYIGFDAVSTAAEETRNPQRNMPIGVIGSLARLHGVLSAGRRGRGRFDRRPAGRGSGHRRCVRAGQCRAWRLPATRRRTPRHLPAAPSRLRTSSASWAGERLRSSSVWRHSSRCRRSC